MCIKYGPIFDGGQIICTSTDVEVGDKNPLACERVLYLDGERWVNRGAAIDRAESRVLGIKFKHSLLGLIGDFDCRTRERAAARASDPCDRDVISVIGDPRGDSRSRETLTSCGALLENHGNCYGGQGLGDRAGNYLRVPTTTGTAGVRFNFTRDR